MISTGELTYCNVTFWMIFYSSLQSAFFQGEGVKYFSGFLVYLIRDEPVDKLRNN